MLEGCHMAVVATRDVPSGDELFLPYGAFYWIKRLGAQGDDLAVVDLPTSSGDSGRKFRQKRTTASRPAAGCRQKSERRT